jgi:hypothetical protein
VDFTVYPIISLIVLGIAFIVAIIIAVKVAAKAQTKTQHIERYRGRRPVYISGEFSRQMELDLRLPYRRFKQLYPSSKITYKEYKALQMRSAFRRSMSSQDNKRMVR